MYKFPNNIIPGIQNNDKPRYVAYHHHTKYSNATTIDSTISPNSVLDRAIELGHTSVTCCEHGSPLSFFEYHSLLNYRKPKIKNGKQVEKDYRNTVKLIYGTEAYFVINNKLKDKTNAHIVIIAKTEKGRKDLNYILSLANEFGYYYKPRLSLDDLLSLDPKDFLITSACFLPGTMVETKEGFKKIEDITSDDYVLTHNNIYEKVNIPTNRLFNGNMVKLELDKTDRIINSTDNHKYYVYDKINNNAIWKEAINLTTDDILLTSIPNINYSNNTIYNNIVLDEKDMMTFGFWLGKGYIKSCDYKIGFNLDIEKFNKYYDLFIKHTMDKFNIKPLITYVENKVDILCMNKDFYNIFCELHNDTKLNNCVYIPSKIKNINKDFDKALLFGYLLSNLYSYNNNNIEIISSTVSKKLHLDILNLYKSLNCLPIEDTRYDVYSLYNNIKLSNLEIIDINNLYEIFKNEIEISKDDIITINNNRYFKRKIQKISTYKYNGIVHCLNVGQSHSFNCEGVIVHNCLGGLWKYNLDSENINVDELSLYENYLSELKDSGCDINNITKEDFKTYNLKTYFKKYDNYVRIKENYDTYIVKVNNPYEKILKQLYDHFGDSFMLEVQPHNTEKQINLNLLIKEMSKKYGVKIIAGTDSHVNVQSDYELRDMFLSSKKAKYEDEDDWILTYDDYNTVLNNFLKQGVFNEEEIREYLDRTLEIETYEEPFILDNVKLPVLPKLRDKTQDEKNKIFKDLIWNLWKDKKEQLKKFNQQYFGVDEVVKFDIYEKDIENEINVVIDTSMADYFLLNYGIIKTGITKYNGVLTKTGRGSGGGFYLNNLLGFTSVDRFMTDIPILSERFISTSRILESRTLPDIDFNVSSYKPFKKATDDYLGEHSNYFMITYGETKTLSAFKSYARAKDIDFKLANTISNKIKDYEDALKYAEQDEKVDIADYVDKEFLPLIEDSKQYKGIIDNISPSPCFEKDTLIMTDDGYKKIQDIKQGDNVLTHNNRYMKVITPMKKYSDIIYNLNVEGNIPIKATGEHPFLVRTLMWKEKYYDTLSKKYRYRRKFSDPYWKHLEDLTTNDFISRAINQNNIVPNIGKLNTNNIKLWWIIGRYIAEGYILDNKIYLSYNKTTIKYLNSLHIKYNSLANKIITIDNYELVEFLSKYNNVKNRYIDNIFFDLPKHLLEYFLIGYKSYNGYRCVNKNLLYGLQFCIHKIYKCGINIIQIDDVYRFSLDSRKSYYDNKHIYQRVINIEKEYYNGFVYNMSVEDDETYTANNIVVHNCSFLLLNEDIRREIGITRIKDNLVANITGKEADELKYLKNDLLNVVTVKVTAEVCKYLGIEQPDVLELELKTKNMYDMFDKIYAQGNTAVINQMERDATIKKLKVYRPKSLSELTSMSAAIRPSFKSMIDVFLNRKNFDYGIPVFDKVIQGKFQKSSFLLFQESIMKSMEFSGIPSGETYTVIKAISKKKIDVIEKYKDIFVNGFMEHGKCDKDTALKVWKIIEDASGYGFNSAHAYCVSADSLYNAWLKYTYPYAFYKICLSLYSALLHDEDKKDFSKISLLVKEMSNFGISLGNIQWGNDNRNYTEDIENHIIYISLLTVKNMNKKVADCLYELYQENKDCNSFPIIYNKLKADKRINKTHINILIRLNYFKKFGKRKKLLKFVDLVETQFNKKTYNKSSLDEETYKMISKYANSGHEDNKKTFRNIDFDEMFKYLFNQLDDEDLSDKEILYDEFKYTENLLHNKDVLQRNFVGKIVAKSYKKPWILFKSMRNDNETWIKLRCKIQDVPTKNSIIILKDVLKEYNKNRIEYTADFDIIHLVEKKK